MNFDITNFQSLARPLPVEGEVCDVNHAEVTHTETNTEIAPLIQQVAAASISETDRLITELQQVRNHLQSEGERVEREMVRYTKLTQMASFTAKIIFDTISQWHPAINRQNRALPKPLWPRPETTWVCSRKIMIRVSGTPPNSMRTLIPKRPRCMPTLAGMRIMQQACERSRSAGA
jgi:hypothetical protein